VWRLLDLGAVCHPWRAECEACSAGCLVRRSNQIDAEDYLDPPQTMIAVFDECPGC
jgi:hypothetical protein